MKNNYFHAYLIGFLLLTCLYSCRCSCTCDRNLGCKILNVKLNANDSLILSKSYWSQSNYYTDKSLKDSVESFFITYQTDSTTVSVTDSIYKYERKDNVKCDETNDFENSGFSCSCDK